MPKKSAPVVPDPVPAPVPAPAPAPEPKKHGNVGRKPTEKQMENLRKGMEAIKKKREELAKLKDENKERIEKGLEPLPPPPPKPVIKVITRPKPEVIERERKPKVSVRDVVKQELEALKTTISQPREVEKIVEKEVVKEVPVEKIVEKTKMLSGSDLLNAIFFNK